MGLFFLLHISPNFLGPSQKINPEPGSSLGPSQNFEPDPLKNGRARAEPEPGLVSDPSLGRASLGSITMYEITFCANYLITLTLGGTKSKDFLKVRSEKEIF